MLLKSTTLSQRIAIVLTAATGVLLLLAAVALDVFSGRVLTAEFDGSLQDATQTFISLIDQEEDELDFDHEALPGVYFEGDDGYFFEMTHDDAQVATSPDLADGFLEGLADTGPQLRAVRVPGGADARVMSFFFYPLWEAQEDSEPFPLVLAPFQGVSPERMQVHVTVGRYTAGLNHVRQQLRVLMLAIFGVTLFVAFLLVHRSTRYGLTPVNELAAKVRKLGPESPQLQVSAEAVPRELQPFVRAINDLLERVDDAYRRQREFSSNVAHELRTPVAELKVISDVTAKWPEDEKMRQNAIDSIGEIANNMHGIIERLLDLSRTDQITVRNEPVVLAEHVHKLIESVVNGSEHGDRFVVDLPDDVIVRSDPMALGIVVRNLLSNALEHSPPGSPIHVRGTKRNGELDLSVINEAPGLTEEDLDFVFDRFWRKDASRTSRENAGLGLAIAKTYADTLGLALLARHESADSVSFTLAGLARIHPHPDADAP